MSLCQDQCFVTVLIVVVAVKYTDMVAVVAVSCAVNAMMRSHCQLLMCDSVCVCVCVCDVTELKRDPRRLGGLLYDLMFVNVTMCV